MEAIVKVASKQYTDFLPDFTQISNKHLHGLNDNIATN